MGARHDKNTDMVADSQRKASDKYQASNIQQFTFKLNVKTDMDIIQHFWHIPNKQGYIKQLIRDDIARRKAEKADQAEG